MSDLRVIDFDPEFFIEEGGWYTPLLAVCLTRSCSMCGNRCNRDPWLFPVRRTCRLNLDGGYELVVFECPMCHWPLARVLVWLTGGPFSWGQLS